MRSTTILLPLVFAAAALAQSTNSTSLVQPIPAKDNEAKIKATVEDRYQEWIAAANKKDAEALTNLYDKNAVLLPPREEAVLGKAAIGEWYKKFLANPDYVPFTEKFASNSFHAVGDVAIDTLEFEGDATRGAKQIHFRGKILFVWKKQEDGSWKIFREMTDEIPAGYRIRSS